MKNKILIFIFITAICLFALYLNSYSITLLMAGYKSDDIIILKAGIDSNNENYRVLLYRGYPVENESAFIHMIQNKIGIWQISHTMDFRHPDTGLLITSGLNTGGFKRFSHDDEFIFISESYLIYHGLNAIKLIDFQPGQLPDFVAANIWQTGNEYTILLQYYGNPTGLNIDLYEIILMHEFIA